MTNPPNLGPRAIDAYNRFARDLASFNYVLRHSKAACPVKNETILALNGMIIVANRLFRRHRDLPRFVPHGFDEPVSKADLAIVVRSAISP